MEEAIGDRGRVEWSGIGAIGSRMGAYRFFFLGFSRSSVSYRV